MRRSSFITAIAACALVSLAAEDSVDSGAAKDGWQKLFNGKDLKGWNENRFKHEPEWRIVDGVLIGHGGQGFVRLGGRR
ncbi:DUF1080 domain-containing protein [bacterium]|nr:DUF1080 domain-containing protein [bacterium]